MALKAGTRADFMGSMAEAMEDAFKEEWIRLQLQLGNENPSLPVGMQDYWRMIFAAVAQGVVRHFKEQIKDSLEINIRGQSYKKTGVLKHEPPLYFVKDDS